MQTMVMILCASISSIAICSINSALLIDNKSLKYIEKNGLLEIYDIKDENVTQKILLNMIELFKELKKQYPKNIQIKEWNYEINFFKYPIICP